MRHVMVTPKVTHGFLAKSLRDLRFEEVMMSFGLFFLQDLDVEKAILSDIQDDDAEVQRAYGNAIKLSSKKPLECPPLALTKHALQDDNYPWGSIISWKLLEQLLATVPQQFLQPVDFNQGDLFLQESKFLFLQFSNQIWLSAHSYYLKGQQLPFFDNFEAALNLWTINGLKEVVTDFVILPSGHGLTGCPIRHVDSQKSFEDRMSIYFPPASQQISSLKHYSQNMAYLDVYYQYLKEWTNEKKDHLNQDLRLIFSQIQCLPAVAQDKKTLVIWQAHQNKMQFIANSKYYSITEIGKPIKSTQITHRAQLPGTVIERQIFEDRYVIYSLSILTD
jgi:hypothetical protein